MEKGMEWSKGRLEKGFGIYGQNLYKVDPMMIYYNNYYFSWRSHDEVVAPNAGKWYIIGSHWVPPNCFKSHYKP